mmetsp:Transcript_12832/g.23108  ORF Transcript_12832/g.23108 Transcript_12832/m.23108 type:complete len:233 (-) Transcript_12832:555-1253(-)
MRGLKKRATAEDDLLQYRLGYPGKVDNVRVKKNLDFYANLIPFTPNGDYIDNVHRSWFGRYDLLEKSHTFIQWLFPIREPGLNREAQELQLHEAEVIKHSPILLNRFLTSYQLMLDFYGVHLVDAATGEIQRNPRWRQQYSNLISHKHNNLRITRILKCLGEIGLEHLKKPFLLFFLHEILVTKELKELKESCINFWVGTLRNDHDRLEVEHFVQQYAGQARPAGRVGRFGR